MTCLDVLKVLDTYHNGIAVVVGGVAAAWTIFIYGKTKKKEAAEWLLGLFNRFYISPEFLKLRMELEFDYSQRLCPLIERVLVDKNAICTAPERELLTDLDTSLNYFEFILHVEKRGRLEKGDRQAIFNYWYELLAEPELASLRMYLERFGYERIFGLLLRGQPIRRYAEYVAFYGSLMKDQRAQEQLLIVGKLKFVGSCLIPGALYDLGEYPGLVKGESAVRGELYKITDPSVFIKLDEYEEFNRTDPEQSLFARRGVRLCKPKVDCWVYFFCGDVSSNQKIDNMGWAEYKKSKRDHK